MYDLNSFRSIEKLFYSPIEAAIRWCDLIAHEAQILELTWDTPGRIIHGFPQWPCLHINTEKILDAIRNHELPYGALGTTVAPGTPVDIKYASGHHVLRD